MCVCVCLSPPEGGDEEEEEDDTGASRVTMSYQSKKEVLNESRDSRATVDLAEEAEVRVSWKSHQKFHNLFFCSLQDRKEEKAK